MQLPSIICCDPAELLGCGEGPWDPLLGGACFPEAAACWLTCDTLMGSEKSPPELSPELVAGLNFFVGFPPGALEEVLEPFVESSVSGAGWRRDLEPHGLEPRANKSPACGTGGRNHAVDTEVDQNWD